MKQNPLPTIIITGTTQDRNKTKQQFVELEILLNWLGYNKPDEVWNNYAITETFELGRLWCYGNNEHKDTARKINYLHESCISIVYKTFRADQVQEIINYVTTYKK